MTDKRTIASSLESIRLSLSDADESFWQAVNEIHREASAEHTDRAIYYVERAFIQTLVLLELMELSSTYDQVATLYSQAKEEGFDKSEYAEEPYLVWSSMLRVYLEQLKLAAQETSDEIASPNMLPIDKNLLDECPLEREPKPPQPSAKYQIHIEQASGLAIGDGAQVVHQATEHPIQSGRAEWNRSALRELLTAAFTDGELTALCYDFFPQVYNELGEGMGKSTKIHRLLEHCIRQARVETLLELVRERNPAQYEHFRHRLRG